MSNDQSSSLIFLVIIVAAFWFLVLRPARKRTSQAAKLQRSIDLGDKVMLTSGIFGHITGLGDETLLLEVADGVEVTAHRQAVARVVPPEELAEQYEYEGDEEDELQGDEEDERGDVQPQPGAVPDVQQPRSANGRTDDERR